MRFVQPSPVFFISYKTIFLVFLPENETSAFHDIFLLQQKLKAFVAQHFFLSQVEIGFSIYQLMKTEMNRIWVILLEWQRDLKKREGSYYQLQ